MDDTAALQPDLNAPAATTPPAPTPRLGEQLRQLRVAAGLTQTELAGDRFSKEYVSQIERGKTRPTAETIAWLAGRLGVDAGYLASGVSTDERGRVEALLARAEALTEAHRYDEAVERVRRRAGRRRRAPASPELEAARALGRGVGADAARRGP